MTALKKQAPRAEPKHPAKPVQGDVDMAALRRDLISKFPKTLARLAK